MKNSPKAINEFRGMLKRSMDEDEIGGSFSVKKAHKTQLRMSAKLIFQDKLPKRIHWVAGVDVAYANNLSIGTVVVLDYESFSLTEKQTAFCRTQFPYVSTLLSFREINPALLCIRKLQTQPDVYLVDGHGFAHPYHCGLASHLGLVLRKPTIGVAKNSLIGEIRTFRSDLDACSVECGRKIVGAAVTTKKGCRPVYVSVGHMISLKTAVKIVKNCSRNNRIPEPILAAHRIATNEKRKINILSMAKTGDSEQVAESYTQGDSRKDTEQTPSKQSR